MDGRSLGSIDDLQASVERLRHHREHVEALKREIYARDATIEQLRGEVAESRALVPVVNDLRAECATLAGRVELANEKEASSRREAQDLQDRLRRTQAEAAESSEQLRRALTDSSTRLAETERTLHFRVADAEAKLEAARRDLRNERDAVAQLQTSLQETEQARKEAVQDAVSCDERCRAEVSKLREDYDRQVAELQSQLRALAGARQEAVTEAAKHHGEAQRAQDHVQSLRTEADGEREARMAAERERDLEKHDGTVLRERLREAEHHISELQAQLTAEGAHLRGDAAEQRRLAQERKQALDDSHAEAAGLRERLANAEQALRAARDELHRRDMQLETTKQLLSTANATSDRAKDRADGLQHQLTEATRANDDLYRRYEAMQAAVDEERKAREHWARERVTLLARFADEERRMERSLASSPVRSPRAAAAYTSPTSRSPGGSASRSRRISPPRADRASGAGSGSGSIGRHRSGESSYRSPRSSRSSPTTKGAALSRRDIEEAPTWLPQHLHETYFLAKSGSSH